MVGFGGGGCARRAIGFLLLFASPRHPVPSFRIIIVSMRIIAHHLLSFVDTKSCLNFISMNIKQQIEKIRQELERSGDAALIETIQQLIDSRSGRSVSEPKPIYSTRSELYDQVLRLGASERAALVQQLLESLDQLDMEKEWFDLAERRSTELESGKVQPLSWQQIRDQVTHGA